MKQFFKIMFASAFGLILGLLLIVLGVVIVGMLTKEDAVVEENSILHLRFNAPIKDRAAKSSLSELNFQALQRDKTLGLNVILENIEKAKNDDNIVGIYLDISTIQTGYATTHEIREALLDFKGQGDSGKWIIAYSEALSQKAYYLASVATEIYLNPQGGIELMGMGSNIPFFTGALAKLEVEAQIIRHGKFKSAVEPFMLDQMSPANREQTEKYVFSIWDDVVDAISKSRSIAVEEINMIADSLWMTTASQALKRGFVDKLLYKDEVIASLRNRLELEEEDDEIQYVKLSKYSRVIYSEEEDDGNSIKREKVAIIYAQGTIVSGKGKQDEIGSETVAKAIKEARENEKVKAIVLRINSGGGSALASDVMLREMVLAKEVKPVVVSMGDVAASGGYYIACMADTILASRTTITGSIGVFGMILNAQKFFNNKLGITFDGVRSNTHSDMYTITRPLTDMEKASIQKDVVHIYDVFITHVSNGRPLSKAEVDSIGQGRVWSGADALDKGLVDVFGGLTDAVKLAASMAGIEDYKILELPEIKTSALDEFLAGMEDEAETRFLKDKLGANYKHYLILRKLMKTQGIQAIVPYDLNLN